MTSSEDEVPGHDAHVYFHSLTKAWTTRNVGRSGRSGPQTAPWRES